jgi:hypothetical protein
LQLNGWLIPAYVSSTEGGRNAPKEEKSNHETRHNLDVGNSLGGGPVLCSSDERSGEEFDSKRPAVDEYDGAREEAHQEASHEEEHYACRDPKQHSEHPEEVVS